MNKVLEDIDDLVELVKTSTEYQEFIKIEEKLNKNSDIKALIAKVKKTQQELVKLEYQKKDIKDKEIELNKYLEQLNNYPLYQDYIDRQNELNNLFSIIKNDINDIFM